MKHFSKLCQITLQHQYFLDTSVPVVEFCPTPDTLQRMKRLQCGFKVADNQLLLYCQSQVTASGQFKAQSRLLQSIQQLSFSLYNRYSQLTEVSDFPLDKNTKAIVNFRNDSIASEISHNLLIPATPEQWQQQENWPLVHNHRFFWPFQNRAQKRGKNWSLQLVGTDQVFSDGVITIQNEGLSIDLTNAPSGLYLLYWVQKEQDRFYVDNTLSWQQPFAILTLQTGSGISPEGQLVEPETGLITSKDFQLFIPPRKTTWRYKITARNQDSCTLGELSIQSPNSEYEFVDNTPASTKGWQFISTQPLALSTQGQKHLVLDSSKQGIMIDNLPSPVPEQLVVEQDHAYSDIYIYL